MAAPRKKKTEEVTYEKIAALDHERLAALIYEYASIDDRFYGRVAHLLLASDPETLSRRIATEIASLKRGRRFIPYRESFAMADRIEEIVAAIDRVADPRRSAELYKRLILTDSGVYGRSDDSSGIIQNAYAQAIEGWQSCLEFLDEETIRNDLEALLICEGYGLRDVIGDAVPTTVLEQIYDKVYDKARRTEYGRYEAFDDKSILLACAHTMNDPERYRRTLELFDEEVSEYDRVRLAEEYERAGDETNALKTLEAIEAPPSNLLEEYYTLKIRLLENKGDEEAVTQAWEAWAHRSRRPEIFARFLRRLPDARRDALKKERLEAAGDLDPLEALPLFHALDAPEEAERYIFDHRDDLQTEYLYGEHLNRYIAWLKSDRPQAAILLYRDAVRSTLAKSVSKYYPWAVRHLASAKKLEDTRREEGWSITPWEEYIAELLHRHRFKKRFLQLYREQFDDDEV